VVQSWARFFEVEVHVRERLLTGISADGSDDSVPIELNSA
jgi:hypothetical protein